MFRRAWLGYRDDRRGLVGYSRYPCSKGIALTFNQKEKEMSIKLPGKMIRVYSKVLTKQDREIAQKLAMEVEPMELSPVDEEIIARLIKEIGDEQLR